MALKPLGHRILVKPDEQEEQTTSGLVLPGDRDHVPTSGVVVAVGDGPERDQRIRLATIARCMSIVEELDDTSIPSTQTIAVMDEIRRYLNQIEQVERPVAVGDRVVYAAESGLKVTEDGHDYILLNEDDAVAIATEEEAAA